MRAPEFFPKGNPTFHNPPWENAGLSVLIVRLSPFADVDKSTPHLFLASCVQAVQNTFVDIAFMPPYHDRVSRLEAGDSLLIGVFSGRCIGEFDAVFISNSYTLELINLPYLFLHSGIPLRSSLRGPEQPLIFLGGSNALAAEALFFYAEPERESALPADSFVDGVFFGEGEEEVPVLLKALKENWGRGRRAAGESKARALASIGKACGSLFIPACPSIPVKAVVHDTENFARFSSYPVLNSPEASTAKLPISAGCPSFCSFCFEGWDRKPYREVGMPSLLAQARALKMESGASTLELGSFNFNTHSDIFGLLLELNRIFMHVNMMSQRVDVLDATPGLLKAELIAAKRSFTLGVEGISSRMRAFLSKGLGEESLCSIVKKLFKEGVREIKFFFILTGHEDEKDLSEFGAFVKCVKGLKRDFDAQTRVIFSFGYLIRMPFTPLQFDELILDQSRYKAAVSSCKRDTETNGFEFRLAMNFDEYCLTQVLALPCAGLSSLLESFAERGFVYDSFLSKGAWEFAQAFLNERKLTHLTGAKGLSYRFPLEWVSDTPRKELLFRRYEDCASFMQSASCFEAELPGGDSKGCFGCAACRNEEEKGRILSHRIVPPQDKGYWTELEGVIRQKQRLRPLFYRVFLPEETAGACEEWKSAFILKNILTLYPSLVENLLLTEDVLSRSFGKRFGVHFGYTVAAFYAFDPALLSASFPPFPRETAGESGFSFSPLGLQDFSPERIERIDLSLRVSRAGYAEAEKSFCFFLKSSYLSFMRKREGEGYVYEIVSKDRKKKQVTRAFSAETREGGFFNIEGGKNLDLGPFVSSAGGFHPEVKVTGLEV